MELSLIYFEPCFQISICLMYYVDEHNFMPSKLELLCFLILLCLCEAEAILMCYKAPTMYFIKHMNAYNVHK